ncbi:MAG: DNA polymerase III subunit delta' [Endomicrobium sp.]|jgi:DNA polymerase-3 subunit delta'|nr:DNA polymerase III subunit delta' [Endomicrobium sp.]
MFEKILGQKKIKEILTGQLKSGKIAHAYIFIGQNGVGKRFTAVEFAKILNCSTNDFTKYEADACGHCLNCLKISKNIHPDIHFIDFAKQAELKDEEVEKQKELKIDTIRYMQKEVSTKIREGKWKFFIVEPAEKMNATAANSLLKTLEEPPENTAIILIARHKETIPKTIVSRSQILFFQPLSQTEIETYLMLNESLTAQKAQEIASLSEGSLEIAKKLLDGDESEGLNLWFKLKKENLCASDILELSKTAARNNPLNCIDAMLAEAAKEFRLYPNGTSAALELLSRSRELLLKNVNAQTTFDNLFIDLYDLKKSDDI